MKKLTKLPTPVREISYEAKKIFVFDDVFPPSLVDSLGKMLLQFNYERRASFDNELAQGISAEQLQSFPKVMPLLTALLEKHHPSMAAKPKKQHLSHAYCAALKYGDFTKIHQDIQCEECATFLYYGNLHWDPAWGGETVFFDRNEDSMVCVTPRPGRLVLFNAALFHRTGVPMRDCPSFRYGMSIFYRCSDFHPDTAGKTTQKPRGK